MTKENLVKIYDKTGEQTSLSTRVEAEQKRLIIATVVVAVFSQEGDIWLSLRSHKKSTHAGIWDLTVAGCVEENDQTNLDAAQRELLEEAGLDTPLESAGKLHFTFEENGGVVVRMPEVFCATTNDVPRIADDEADGFAKYPMSVFRQNFERYPEIYIPNIREEIELAYSHLGIGGEDEV